MPLELSPSVSLGHGRAVAVADLLGYDAQETMMTAADRLREEGRKEGREKFRTFFAKLLALRFGKLDETTLEDVEALDFERVEELSDRLLDPDFEATSLEAFLAVDAAE